MQPWAARDRLEQFKNVTNFQTSLEVAGERDQPGRAPLSPPRKPLFLSLTLRKLHHKCQGHFRLM